MKLKKLFLAAGLTAAATVSVTAQKAPEPCDLTPVSYTHLTLPTNSLV